ncbi:hypothetical protein ROHU_001069 [Labeo rohita]|uniref:Uncharacterized protein n=1 Tax=Labeo rohita TaxID=84645 RepID=A0A498P1J6_LABRO|nr:hypothetical protein ROHU_001069 [Labeo rohita]
MKATSIFLGTEKDSSDMPVKTPDLKPRDRKMFCPYCDAKDHYLNGCASFQRLNEIRKCSGYNQTRDVGVVEEPIKLHSVTLRHPARVAIAATCTSSTRLMIDHS